MKIRIISPYFLGKGKSLPAHFQLYLNSCEKNPRFEWLIFTNAQIHVYSIPQNVTVVQQTFDEFRENVQKKFDFDIFLETPYKLCDYKVLYGYIFSEYLKGYDFWGYADSTDLIWGKLSAYITEEILKKYDKIYTKGHLTLYRNVKMYTELFLNYQKNGITYRNTLQSKEFWATDETGEINISNAWKEAGFSEYVQDTDIADISPMRFEFHLATQLHSGKIVEEKNKNRIFEWNNGHLYGYRLCENNIIREEYAYVHFQKRNMSVAFETSGKIEKYNLIPNQFVKANITNADEIQKLTRQRLFYVRFFQLKWKGAKDRIRKLKKGKII